MEKQKVEIEAWLTANAGRGSARYGGREGTINHWLNGDDWCYYNQWIVGDSEDLETKDTVFVFRDEKAATEFALRFA
jgi:ABC-type glycerol-3-phosphate transport system substrate-binding protein